MLKKRLLIAAVLVLLLLALVLYISIGVRPLVPEQYSKVWLYSASHDSKEITLSEEQVNELIDLCRKYRAYYVGGDSLESPYDSKIFVDLIFQVGVGQHSVMRLFAGCDGTEKCYVTGPKHFKNYSRVINEKDLYKALTDLLESWGY